MRMNSHFAMTTLAVILSLALGGCGDKKEEKAATQVAAKVNSDEITVHQLNHELSRMSNLAPEQAKQAANQVLKTMVDQQILVQKSIEDKLDRDPQVLQTLEAARRQILAQAYVQKLTANLPKPGEVEINEYYGKHPELFGERRIYRLQEITVQTTPENVDSIKAQLAKSKSLNDLGLWLKAQNIPSRSAQSTKTAEQLPLEILPRLHRMKDGQAMTIATGKALNILVLVGSQTQALGQEQARPLIERFLAIAKKREAAEANLKMLKEKAKVEYLGDYADAGKEVAKPAKVQPAAADQPKAIPAAADTSDQAIEKGLSGLK